MTPTPTQQQAIDLRDGELLVAASAGSGKTETLARRVVALLTDGPAPLDIEQLLVVTFTRAAAAELRARVGRLLRARIEVERDPPRREHLRRQWLRLPMAEIGTLDAWCQRVLRAHFLEAGVDAGFGVLSPEQERLLQAECLDQLLEEVFAAGPAAATAPPATTDAGETRAVALDTGLIAETRAWLGAWPTADDEWLRRLIRGVHQMRGQVLSPAAWFRAAGAACHGDDDALRRAAQEQLAAFVREECAFQRQQALLLTGIDAPGRAYLAQLAAWEERLREPGALLETLDEQTRYFRAFKAKAEVDQLIKQRWLDARLRKRLSRADAEDIIRTAPLAARRLRTLLALERVFAERLQAVKRNRAQWSFEDIQRLTLDLLGNDADAAAPDAPRRPTATAERLRVSYRAILVDEFQDTSAVQVELIRLVTGDEAFYVGDVKQSIYGFRRAAPWVFRRLAAELAGGGRKGRVLYLSDNFRSHADLLDPLNEIIARLFSADFGGTDYAAGERLSAQREEIQNPAFDGAPRISLCLIAPPSARLSAAENDESADEAPDDDRGEGASGDEADLERIEREARWVADELARLLAAGPCIPERSTDGALTLRPLRRRDVAILLRAARQNAMLVAGVLRERGIAAQAGGRETLLDSIEVCDLLNVLRLLGNRRQDLPLAAYLRCPLSGLDERDLLNIRQFAPDEAYVDAALRLAAACAAGEAAAPCFQQPVSGSASEEQAQPPKPISGELSAALQATAARVQRAMSQLDGWRDAARQLELPDLLRRIMRDGGYAHFASALPLGAQRVAALRALLQLAETFGAGGGAGADEFVAHLDALRAEDQPVIAPAQPDDDAVRILTIHAAKGLEFPIVFLMNTAARFNQQTAAGMIQLDETGAAGLRYFDLEVSRAVRSATHFVQQHTRTQREREEELRLLYVAMTRARERLYLTGVCAWEAWATLQAQTPEQSRLPLITRMQAGNMLEWTLAGVSAAGLQQPLTAGGAPRVHVVRADATTAEAAPSIASAPGPSAASRDRDIPVLAAADAAWVAESQRLIELPVDRRRAGLPLVVSVSALKQRDADFEEDDRVSEWPRLTIAPGLATERAGHHPSTTGPNMPGHFHRADGADRSADAPTAEVAVRLRMPAFAGLGEERARRRGTAVHRVLQHLDLAALGSAAALQAELERMRYERLIAEDEWELVDSADLLWLGGTAVGGHLIAAREHVVRELPFVYALPLRGLDDAVIVRGIVDALVVTEAALELIDYKTDALPDEAALAERVALYSHQLAYYAAALQSIYARPVRSATLIFLSKRRIVTPPLEIPTAIDPALWMESDEP